MWKWKSQSLFKIASSYVKMEVAIIPPDYFIRLNKV